MRKLIKEFTKLLLNKLNEYFVSYYEEAPKTTKFPYLVVPSITVSPLNAGYSCLFDVEIYNNELSKITLESILDTLRDNLNNYSFINDKIAFHIGYESENIIKSTEQDLSIRRITFSARIFRKEN